MSRRFSTMVTDGSQSACHSSVAEANAKHTSLTPMPQVDEKLSHVFGRSMKELKYCTYATMMEGMAKREPHSTAIVVQDEGICKTFKELQSDVNKLVNGMVLNLGLKRGDKVGLYSYNNYQFVLVQLACGVLGLVLNPFNPSYKAHEFYFVLGIANAKVLFTPGKGSSQSPLNDHHSVVCDKSIGQLQREGKIDKLTHIVLLDGELDRTDLPLEGVEVLHWHLACTNDDKIDPVGPIAKEIESVKADDTYAIFYTSGTTGIPKGAAITQFNAINDASLTVERLFNQRGPNYASLKPILCLPLPLFHVFAGIIGITLPFLGGGSTVLTGARYSIQSIVESIQRCKCNSIFLTPTILFNLLAYVEHNRLVDLGLKMIFVGGASVMSELVRKAYKILSDLEEVRIGYGTSENGGAATIATSQESLAEEPLSVGLPLDFTEIRIAGLKTGDTTLLCQPGEVQTRGFNTMLGYYNDDDKTREVITPSRWYRTGDLGVLDRTGRLRIVGRIKELIIKGGENVYPAEVEAVLHTHNLIEDAHVFGVPDKRYGEEVCAWIKLDKTKCANRQEDELKKEVVGYCKQKLAYSKVPRHILFVEEFPMTAVKKIKKYEMQARTTKMLNLDQ